MRFDLRARTRKLQWFAAAIASLALAAWLAGCATKDDTSADDADVVGSGEPLPPPTANIQINYTKPGDRLSRATVTKFFAAEVIASRDIRSGRTASIVRFDGGVPIWEMKGDDTVVGRLSEVGRTLALPKVEYGKVPQHFTQIIPDEGPPEPLDRGAYYVFEIERASGSTSYQAVKILADGSLEAYAAQPRAGSSYLLCCNVSSDFPVPVVVPDQVIPEEGNPGSEPSAAPSPDQGVPPPASP